MYVSITSILLSMGAKCLLNWALVFLQKEHMLSSFLGVFSASLAIVDTALTFTVSSLYICSNTYVVLLGLQLTKYHICLLVQILEQVYRALQWPVVVMAGLDHFCTVRLQAAPSKRKLAIYLFLQSFLWYAAVVYVFRLSDFIPVLEDVSHEKMHRCWVFHSAYTLQIATLLLLTLGCAALYARRPRVLSCCILQRSLGNPALNDQTATSCSKRSLVRQTLCVFVNTWTLFLVALVVLPLPAGIPAYLDLNMAWLCFLNSLLIAFVLCAACPTLQLSQDLAVVPPDSFCEWRFNFSPAAEDQA